MRVAFAAIVIAALLSGCASSRSPSGLEAGNYRPIGTVTSAGLPSPAAGLPTPQRADLVSEARPYLIGPFDKLSIEVFGIEELNRQVQTDASGRISFPMAGVIDAQGKTPAELGAEIEARLREQHVRNPQVTVNLLETVSQVVTVDGQVRQPGLYPVVGRMTLMRAIATAQGATEFARLGNVLVFRRVGNQELVGLYNLNAIRNGLYPDPEIFAHDTVVVDENRARRIFRDLLQVAPLLTTPLVAVLQNSN